MYRSPMKCRATRRSSKCRGALLVCLSLCVVAVCAVSVPRMSLETRLGTLRETNGPNLCQPHIKQTTGYFNIDPSSNKNYFYWFFPSMSQPANDPIILWLTGGPGCSGEIALFMENGPCMFDSNNQMIPNPFSWTANASVIYIDQPAGTGFSYSDPNGVDTEENGVASDLNIFLRTFFSKHPEFASNDFYIFAESYGGHYAPATAWYVKQQNDLGARPYVNLKGVGIGNGLTDPLTQYQYYPEMIYNYTSVKLGHPLVSLDAYTQMVNDLPQCTDLIQQCYAGHASACSEGFMTCNFIAMQAYQQTGRNVYDIRVPCGTQPLCYDMSAIRDFLGSPDVRYALNVTMEWEACNMGVNRGFQADFLQGYQNDVALLLEHQVPVLIYAGDCDYICNWIGNFHWTLALPWSGQSGYGDQMDRPWFVTGSSKPTGTIRTFQSLTFVKVLDAGHMVPHDQPYVAQQLVRQFTGGYFNMQAH